MRLQLQFIESKFCTVIQEQTVNRTPRERWLSWPWRPWQRTKVIAVKVPSPNLIRMPDGSFVGHPVTIAELRKKLEAAAVTH